MPNYTVTDPTTNKTITLEGDSEPTEQELNDIFSQVHTEQPQEYSQGFFKTYEGQPEGFLQKADVLAGGLANKAIQATAAPFELAGEAIRTGVEGAMGRPSQMVAPSLFGGQGATDPVSYANRLTRTAAAGLTAPLRGQGMAQQAGAEYDRPLNALDRGVDIASNMGLAVMAPGLANAPIEVAGQGVKAAGSLFNKGGSAVDAAVPFARRALGITKPMLKTTFSRGKANDAARIALENDVIPYSGNPETMLNNASEIAAKSGSRLGNVRKGIPANLSNAFKDLMQTRKLITDELPRGGTMESAHSAIDSVQNDIMGLVGKKPTADTLNAIRSRVASKVNFLADLATQKDSKEIQNSLGNSIRELVKQFTTPEEFAKYLMDQKYYSAAQLMMKGLNNEIAGQMGNSAISLTSTAAGAARLASGDLPGAAAAIGLTEAMKRRGAGFTARAIQDIGEMTRGAGNILGKTADLSSGIGASGLLAQKFLDKETALKYLEKHGGNKKEAREAAKKDGYKVKPNAK